MIFPAALPQILTGLRIALGVAWLVVVAAEMIAVNSGLGYLIIDARNAGKRYDLVVAGMVLIGFIGLAARSADAPAGALRRVSGVTDTDEEPAWPFSAPSKRSSHHDLPDAHASTFGTHRPTAHRSNTARDLGPRPLDDLSRHAAADPIHVLERINLDVRRGRVRLHRRPLRLRQDHAA